MGIASTTIENIASGRANASYAMVVRVAKAANVTIEALLSPLKSVEVCPTCGARKGAR
jgi:transcriptional regulator with XRE-family HTH domain